MRIIILFCSYFISLFGLSAQGFYDQGTIQKIEVNFTQSNWDYMLDTAKAGSEGFIMANWVRVNGQQIDSVGIKYKGNSSYQANQVKNPIHIALDEYHGGQNYEKYTSIKLNNGFSDPSMVREVYAYAMLSNYMDCPVANFAQLYINGAYMGLYSNVEAISDKFYGDHYHSSTGMQVKCNPQMAGPGSSAKSNLKYLGANESLYYTSYEIKSNEPWDELIDLCDTVTNQAAALDKIMDVDRAIWMLAWNNVMVNLDSYSGGFVQNYYLYRDETDRFLSTVWDLNMCFGGFPMAGGGGGMGGLSLTQMQQMSPTLHATDTDWPLINDILGNPMYKRMYIAHMRTITEEMLADNTVFANNVLALQGIIDTAVQSDANKFYTYAQFQSALTSNISAGPFTIPGISNLMNARKTYLNSTAEYLAAAPNITNSNISLFVPVYGEDVGITATVSNANAVYIGYRFSRTDKFTRTLMFDDGAHNDMGANDGIYGISLNMAGGILQYYIYADNANAGIFKPQRAEHEFYEFYALMDSPAPGEVVINELLAKNDTKEKDEYSEREDWIELYNTSDKPIALGGTYLSDKLDNLTKWKFPDNAYILPHGYLMIWADNDAEQVFNHTNFGLGGSGESIYFTSEGSILDSVAFDTQTPDISWGRFPNGTGDFVAMPTTFSAVNSLTVDVTETPRTTSVTLRPNPATDMISFDIEATNAAYEVFNTLGNRVLSGRTSTSDIRVSNLPSGLYILSLRTADGQNYVARFVKQ